MERSVLRLQALRAKRRATFAKEGFGGRRKGRAEFADGERFEGAELIGEFDGGDASLAIEPAEKIGS